MFVNSCIHFIAITPNQLALLGAQTASVWSISSLSAQARASLGTPTKAETSGGPGDNCTRPSTLCLCDTGPLAL